MGTDDLSLLRLLHYKTLHPRFRRQLEKYMKDKHTSRRVKPSPFLNRKALSWQSESTGGALVRPPQQPSLCSCGASSCKRCQAQADADFCAATSDAILEIDDEQRALVLELQNLRELKRLRETLMRSAGYDHFTLAGAADAEQTERDAQRRLDTLVAKRQKLIDELCQRCGVCPMGEEGDGQ